MRDSKCGLLPLCLCGFALPFPVAAQATVDVYHDSHGIPHVEVTNASSPAEAEQAALWGVGWATARDRWFQMNVTRLMMDGELAKYFMAGPNNAFVDSDVAARQLGWRARADEVAGRLPPDLRDLLQAYAGGVNAYVTAPTKPLHHGFADFGVPTSVPWTVSDCLVTWYRLAKEFANDGLEELVALQDVLDAGGSPTNPQEVKDALFADLLRDDETAVLKQSDFPPAVQQAMADYADQHGVNQILPPFDHAYQPSFSQVVAVGSNRMIEGSAGFWSGPRLPVYAPNMFYEWRMQCSEFHVRGIGVPGCPNVLVGYAMQPSFSVAWGLTALAADQADLFSLTLNGNGYTLDDDFTPFDPDDTTTVYIKNPDGSLSTTTATYKNTVWGPVVASGPQGTFAVARVPLHDDPGASPAAIDTFAALMRMYRATSEAEYTAALEDWSYPSANMVFALGSGRVGHAMLGAIPVRDGDNPLAGILPQDGSVSSNGWQEFLPHAVRPLAVRDENGVFFSGNHLPIGSWYPMSAYVPGAGDTERSYRLRRLEESLAGGFFTERTLDTQPRVAAREVVLGIVEIANAMPATARRGEAIDDPQAVEALGRLNTWIATNGGAMQGGQGEDYSGVLVADRFPRRLAVSALFPSYQVYGRGEDALKTMVRELRRKIAEGVAFDNREIATVENMLIQALQEAMAIGGDPPLWGQKYDEGRAAKVTRFDSLSQGGSVLGAGQVVEATALGIQGLLHAVDKDSLADIDNAAYNTVVVLDGTGQRSRACMGLGQSELPGDPHEFDQAPLWAGGLLRDASLQTPGVAPTFTATYPTP